jgi:predicted anti-sigma-YlaC factor YlaD
MKDRACASVQQLLALRPADLDEGERRQTEAHLAACTECANLAHSYAAQDRALQALPTAGLEAAARQRFLARLDAERARGTVRPRTAWVLGAVALAAVALVAGLLLWPGTWLGSAARDTPTIGPTQVLMPSPTITPTTALTATPMGERAGPLSTSYGEAISYTPLADPWHGPDPIAFYGAPGRPREAVGP